MFRTSLLALAVVWSAVPALAELRVGAAITDVTPPQLPVLVNGSFFSRTADQVNTPVQARSLVLDDGEERIALVVVDSCMMPRPLLDDAKHLASKRTEIRPERIMISATHTHSAPSCMGALGTDADPAYVSYLREKLAEAVAEAEARLQPAEVGWGSGDAAEFTAVRRWIRRSDRLEMDPFGNPTVQANMHAARNWDDVTGPSGPEDPELSMLAFRTPDGRPLAVLANFSMHYFGDQAISADYFGRFCDGFAARVETEATERSTDVDSPLVAILSHGCSGDIWRRDYSVPADSRPEPTIGEYTEGLLAVALKVYDSIEYRPDVDLRMAEARMRLKYRVPDQQRLQWARQIVEKMGGRLPENREEVYAREQVLLHERQDTEVVMQAIRIGDWAIATTPNETYALTGLKLKSQSPFDETMVIELANGGDGYIPPPEQHVLGGYNTWPARTAGLEVEAEPKVTEQVLQLLEQVAGRPRRPYRLSDGPAVSNYLERRPLAYWRLNEWAGPMALDRSGNHRHAVYEPGVVFFLDGPRSDRFCQAGETNRAAHFAGGRLRAHLGDLGEDYSVSFWFWNGMPADARETTGWLFSRDHDHGTTPRGDHLGIGGTATEPGKLVFLSGDGPATAGRTTLRRWTWQRVTLVRQGDRVRVYLNDSLSPEIDVRDAGEPSAAPTVFFGGRSDDAENFEGRLDEIVVFDEAITPEMLRGAAPPEDAVSP